MRHFGKLRHLKAAVYMGDLKIVHTEAQGRCMLRKNPDKSLILCPMLTLKLRHVLISEALSWHRVGLQRLGKVAIFSNAQFKKKRIKKEKITRHTKKQENITHLKKKW